MPFLKETLTMTQLLSSQQDPPPIPPSDLPPEYQHPEKQFISFTLHHEEYGIPITSVREIKAWSGCTRLPNTPEYVLGVLNLRGTIVPIYDLRTHFGFHNMDIGDRHVVMILYIEDRLAGLVVDAVSDILSVSESQIQDLPHISGPSGNRLQDSLTDIESPDKLPKNFNLLAGIINLKHRMVSILNVDHIFALKDFPGAEGGDDFLPPPIS